MNPNPIRKKDSVVRRLKKKILCLLFFTLTTTGGWAKEVPKDLTDLSLEDLMQVKIETVSKFEQRVIEAPASVTIITREEIKKYGYRNLSDLLRSIRGLYVNYDRAYHYLGIRGFARPGDYNMRFLMLINGHRVNEPIYDSGAIGDDFPLDIDLIDRLEVIRGPGSSLYGTNAFLGIINMITRKGEEFQGFEASGEVESLYTYKGRLSYGRKFKKGPEVLVSGSLLDSQGDRRLYYREYNSPDTNFGIAKDCDDRGYGSFFSQVSFYDFTLTGVYHKRKKEIPTGAWETVFNNQGNRIIDKRAYLDITYKRKLAHGLDIEGKIYYDHYYYQGDYVYDYAAPGVPPSRALAKDKQYAETVGGEFNFSKTLFGKHQLVAGGEYRNIFDMDLKYTDRFNPHHHRKSFRSWAFYLQDEFEILSNVRVNLGARYDYYSTFGGTINPRVSLIYHPFEKTILKLIYARAFRAPNAFVLYYADGVAFKANTDLDPEKVRNLEFIFHQYLGFNLWGTATVFNQRVNDLISQQVDPADGLLIYQNADQVEGKGLEFELEGRWKNGWRGRLSYAWQRSINQKTDEVLTNSPRHLFKLNAIVPIWKEKLFLGLEKQYAGRRKTFSGGATKGFFITNLTLFNQNWIKGLEVSGSVYNLFNEKYSDPVGEDHRQDKIEQDGRTFRLKATYRF